MIELRQRSIWERFMRLWPAERRRQDARLEAAIDRLVRDPTLPCSIEGVVIPHGFGEERTSAQKGEACE